MCVLQAVKGRDCPWRLSCSARGCWPSPLAGRCTPASTPSTSLWLQVRALLDTKPQLLHFTVQHPCPLNDFLVVWGKKIPYYLFIFAFLQVSSCTPSAARNGGMEIEILFFFLVEEAAWCGYGNALPRVSPITVSSRETLSDLSCILAAAGAARSLT